MDLGYSWYWLASDQYRFSPANNAEDKSGKSGSFVGHEFDMRIRWQITSKMDAILGYAHFTPGDFIRNTARPNDTDFAYIEINLNAF